MPRFNICTPDYGPGVATSNHKK
ncbi:MAG: hypothetical protein QOJ04_5547, partial [Caballeronia sp.]|nr:hypothetical protein [Caballeronia sp.]